jgi:hypothetical protein
MGANRGSHRGERGDPLADRRGTNERLTVERNVLRDLPSLRPTMRLGVTRKGNKLATVRIGSARYSVPQLCAAGTLM